MPNKLQRMKMPDAAVSQPGLWPEGHFLGVILEGLPCGGVMKRPAGFLQFGVAGFQVACVPFARVFTDEVSQRLGHACGGGAGGEVWRRRLLPASPSTLENRHRTAR